MLQTESDPLAWCITDKGSLMCFFPQISPLEVRETASLRPDKPWCAVNIRHNCLVSFEDERISGRNQRHQVTSIQKTEAMRAVAGRRDWKAGFGKFLFGHKHVLLNGYWMENIKRTAQGECVLTLRPHWSQLSHRPAGSLWATRTLSSYQLWRPHFQTWQCRAKTAERPGKCEQDGDSRDRWRLFVCD